MCGRFQGDHEAFRDRSPTSDIGVWKYLQRNGPELKFSWSMTDDGLEFDKSIIQIIFPSSAQFFEGIFEKDYDVDALVEKLKPAIAEDLERELSSEIAKQRDVEEKDGDVMLHGIVSHGVILV